MPLPDAVRQRARESVRRLLDEAKGAGTPHFIYVSIVGIDNLPGRYFRHKVDAEELVRGAGLPYTVARITPFHSLVNALCEYAARFPIAMLPLTSLYQPIDERDAAVKALLAMSIRACRKHGKYVGICGQGPSDHPDLARWLMEQGIDSLSLNPDTVVSTWMALAETPPGKKSAVA